MRVKKYFIIGMFCMISIPLFSQTMYLELNFHEERSNNLFAGSKSPLEIFRIIEKAENDKKVQGIILNIGSISTTNRDFLWELRNALEQFKSGGKKVYAFISNADMDVYFLASVADKIVMDELGVLTMLGYSINRGYVRQTLEKLGIGARELRYFEYKSAAEMYTRDSMSDADRSQYNDYLDDIFNLTRETLINARNWTADEFDTVLNHEFLYSAENALRRNLVDRVGRKDAVLEAIMESEGEKVKKKEDLNFALYGAYSSSLTGTETIYSPPGSGGLFRRPPVIAVVHANGQTDMESGMAAFGLSRTIRDLADNRRVKAIVIRINSPGGSAEAADYVAEAVSYAKQKKPVVVSMGSMAASGGYWAAMNASHIMATPYTITGSIGVIGSWFYDNGLTGKIGLVSDSIQRGAHADLMTGFLLPYRNLTAAEEERYKNYMLNLYRLFTEKVALGRGMDIEKVEAVAQGRIFSGTRALEAGLIDSVGSFSDALRKAQELAGIPEGKRVRYNEYPKLGFMDRLRNKIPFLSIFSRGSSSQDNAVEILAGLFLPADIRYRLEKNGQVMPILSLDFFQGKH
ncbi:MAG: signal peptide peptidase SppA [Treponema sp.]|jgi:protease-4|nr:signal peptide peptidase SppA [Treponema sp.]